MGTGMGCVGNPVAALTFDAPGEASREAWMSPPVVLSKQQTRCSADLRLLAARSAIEAREEGAGVEGSSVCRQSVAAMADRATNNIVSVPCKIARQKSARVWNFSIEINGPRSTQAMRTHIYHIVHVQRCVHVRRLSM